MATEPLKKLPLIAIVGPTASGKTGLAVELARRFNGEIICADSRTVYKFMDIATAKPTATEQQQVQHWGIDLVNPNERFTVADFKEYADEKIREIRSRGHIPFLVGGTGLYVDAVVFDYQLGTQVDEKLRQKLQLYSLEELHAYSEKHHINLPENYKNKRYVIRAIENSNTAISQNRIPITNVIVVGIATDKTVLEQRIRQRIEQLLENGVVAEATKLADLYGWGLESMKANIYPYIKDYIENELTLEGLIDKATAADRHLAKRQRTWFKRNKCIHWATLDDAKTYLEDILATIR